VVKFNKLVAPWSSDLVWLLLLGRSVLVVTCEIKLRGSPQNAQ